MESAEFAVHATGEETGQTWHGRFRAKVRLSHTDRIRRDHIRREILGANPQDAQPRTIQYAEMFSQLDVRLIETPDWWKEANGGRDLEDDEVIVAVYNEAMLIESRARDERKKKTDEAKADLTAHAASVEK